MGKKSAPYVPPPPVDYTAESKAREKEQEEMETKLEDTKQELLDRKKNGRYSLLLTGGEGDQEEANVKTRSLLGSGGKPK
jgi:hypothetical protein